MPTPPLSLSAQLIKAPIPSKRSGKGNAWSDTVNSEMLRQLRLNPGATFRLSDAAGEPIAISMSQATSIRASCPEPFRIHSRAATPNPRGPRLIWISFDPAYWEKRNKR